MTSPRLPSPLIDVWRHSDPDPIRVQVENPDLIRYDDVRARNKWPAMTDDPWRWQTFITWAAMKRLGHLDGMTYDDWQADVRAVDVIEEQPGDVVRPTQVVAAAGSSAKSPSPPTPRRGSGATNPTS